MKHKYHLLALLLFASTASFSQTMECEPNDLIDDACVKYITENGSYAGTFSAPSDVDEYWRIPKGSKGYIKVTYTVFAGTPLDMEFYEILDSTSWTNTANFASVSLLPDEDTMSYTMTDDHLYYIYLPASTAMDEPWEITVSGTAEFANPFVGIEKTGINGGIQVSPTLVDDYINVTFPSQLSNAELVIYDVEGRLIQRERVTSTTEKIDVTALNGGMYFLSVIEQGSSVATFKVTKK